MVHVQWMTVTVDNTDEMPKFFNWIIAMNALSANITHEGTTPSYGMNVISIPLGGYTEQYSIVVGNQGAERAWYMVSCIGYI